MQRLSGHLPEASGPAHPGARGAARPRHRASGAALALAAALLAGCAAHGVRDAAPAIGALDAPQLRLAPALLGRSLDLQQHITAHAPGHDRELDVLLEADASHVRLGVVALGQVAARLDWDGTTLTEVRAPWWPPAVSGSRILSDLQLTLWPVDAIQAALPPGWRLAESGPTRTLSQDGAVVAIVTRRGPRVVEIEQQRAHYRLTIESQELGAPSADAAASAPPVPDDSTATRP